LTTPRVSRRDSLADGILSIRSLRERCGGIDRHSYYSAVVRLMTGA
jgi:hypothetical protein